MEENEPKEDAPVPLDPVRRWWGWRASELASLRQADALFPSPPPMLGAIYHVKPEWVSDTETLQAIFLEGNATLADQIKQAFPDADADSENLANTAKLLNQAIVNYQEKFGLEAESLILHRKAFLEVLAETGM